MYCNYIASLKGSCRYYRLMQVGVGELHIPLLHVAKDSPFMTYPGSQLKEMCFTKPPIGMIVLLPFLGASRSLHGIKTVAHTIYSHSNVNFTYLLQLQLCLHILYASYFQQSS